jgi:probable HAF family extracellular repeat protein
MEDLGGSSGTHSYSEARGVNNHGDVIGTFLWENGSAVKNAPGGYAINDAGEILVGSNIWQNGVYYPLGGFGSNVSGGYGINGFGQVVGEFRLTGDPNQRAHAFLWTPTMPNATNGTMIDLGTLGLFGEAYASGINPQGQVVGTSYSSDPFQGHAFVWTPTTPNGTNGSMTDLGPGIAFAINASGVIVGEGGWCPQSPCSGAVIWRNGVRTDLQGLIPPGSAVGLTLAYAINDSGQILAWTDGSRRALLLTPVAAPRLSTPSIQSNSQLRFTLLGEAGRSYTIQASTNLVNWTALTNFVSATGTNEFIDPTAANFSRKFYRAVTH